MRRLTNRLLVGDALTELRRLPAASADMILTSPPYFRLRDYGVAGQLGLEATVEDWVRNLHAVAGELARVLTPTGTLWLNLGDSYATHPAQGAARKSLLLGPERLALQLLADGWLLRNKIVWQKSNPMPTSVRDRLACTWESIYIFARQPRYYFNLDAIREPHRSRSPARPAEHVARPDAAEPWRGPNAGSGRGLARLRAAGRPGHPLGKNPGDVWRLASSSYRGDHRATFPMALAEQAIRAGCPERCCSTCGRPWQRRLLRALGAVATRGTLTPTCACPAATDRPGLVLDPFFGAGSTALAAEQLGRDWLGIELSAAFAAEARQRLERARGGAQMAA
ncbi:site-specific DNA-methyltransferase [Kineococcus glutinatus]|uniref:Methyltransferase n=1 Tax=Kineococcus glutinatus TaxID=1070872 RepID=A0ABP9HF47_9ACTN